MDSESVAKMVETGPLTTCNSTIKSSCPLILARKRLVPRCASELICSMSDFEISMTDPFESPGILFSTLSVSGLFSASELSIFSIMLFISIRDPRRRLVEVVFLAMRTRECLRE